MLKLENYTILFDQKILNIFTFGSCFDVGLDIMLGTIPASNICVIEKIRLKFIRLLIDGVSVNQTTCYFPQVYM